MEITVATAVCVVIVLTVPVLQFEVLSCVLKCGDVIL